MADPYSRKGAGRAVRVEDVAREAGVSPITVSRALRTPEKVKAETLERVLAAVKKTRYQVNPIASSLRSGRSQVVSVFVASLQNPHFAAAMQGALDAFEGSRFHLMFAQTGYSAQLSIEDVETLLPFRPAALMFTGVVRREDTRTALRALNVPIIEMWGGDAEPLDMLVSSSGLAGGRLMGEHFGQRGFSRIAYSGHTKGRGNDRFEGFRQGLAAFGRRPDLVVARDGTNTFGDGMSALDEVLDAMPDCDAIFFGSDLLAVGAIVAARRRNIDLPGRLAIAGYGDLDFAGQVDPPLTTIQVADYEIGRRAAGMLLKRLEGEPIDNPVLHVPVRLEVRASTGAAPAGPNQKTL